MVDEWKVDFTDDDEDGIQTASFNSQNSAEVWIDNQEVQNRYDNVHFKVVDGPYKVGSKDESIIKCEDQEKLLESKKGFDPQEYIKEFKDYFGYEDSYFPERDYSHSYDALAHELALQQPIDTEAREIEGDAVMLLVTSGSEDAIKAGKALGDCMMKKTKHDNETLIKKMRDAYLAVARLNSSTELDESVDRLDNIDAKAKSLKQFNNKTTAFWEKVTELTDDGSGLGQHIWLRSPNGVLVCCVDDYGEKPTYYVPDIESNQLVEVGYESFSGFKYNYDPHNSFREDMPSDIPIDLMESSVGTYSAKIWVDDIRPAPNGYLWLKSVDDFIDYIVEHGTQGIAVIDIDHDAGDYAKFGGDYIKCLDYLESIGASGINVRVHSANPVGVENMRQIIKRNGWTEVHDVIDEHFTHEEQMSMLFESTPSSAYGFKGGWDTLDASHPAYSTVEQSLKDDDLEVGNVYEIGNGQYYIAEIYGKSIDCTDAQRWLKCLDIIKKFINQMRTHGCGDVWLVDMVGGNEDDGVFTLRVGFMLLSSPFSSDGASQLDEDCLDEDGNDDKKKIVDKLKDAAKAFTDNAPNSDPEKFADIKVVFDDLASAVGDYDFKKKKVLKEEDKEEDIGNPKGE